MLTGGKLCFTKTKRYSLSKKWIFKYNREITDNGSGQVSVEVIERDNETRLAIRWNEDKEKP